jgi:hypothetical protein
VLADATNPAECPSWPKRSRTTFGKRMFSDTANLKPPRLVRKTELRLLNRMSGKMKGDGYTRVGGDSYSNDFADGI